MEFQKRLEKAIERGQRASDARSRAEHEQALSEDELRRLHSQYRLHLSEHIERCLGELPNHFPGFHVERIFGERGWGAALKRDDLAIQSGKRANFFSRLEVAIRPYSPLHVLELNAKATVRNKEAYNRTHYSPLAEVDVTSYEELIDLWVLEFAEIYAVKT